MIVVAGGTKGGSGKTTVATNLAIMRALQGYDVLLVDADDQESATDFTGIRLRRDNWVSVRYAEELNSTTSSVLLQRADRHGILGEKPPDFQVSL
jgi:cellulose biosynthesis protein BcsQ